jgi:hypothetical protein
MDVLRQDGGELGVDRGLHRSPSSVWQGSSPAYRLPPFFCLVFLGTDVLKFRPP